MGKRNKNKDTTSSAVGDGAPVLALVDTTLIGKAKRTTSWFAKIKDAMLALALGFAVVSRFRAPEPAAPEVPSAARVDALLAHRAVLHVGGQHRGGTTILWRALAAAGHADATAAAAAAGTGDDFANWGDSASSSSGGGESPARPALVAFDQRLACKAQRRYGCKGAVFGCSCMEAEGLFVQSVLPTWRLDQAANGDGLGRFALANHTRRSEADLLAGDREKLFADWAPLWGLLPLDPPSRSSDAKSRHRGDSALLVERSADDVSSAGRGDGPGEGPARLLEVLLEKTPSTTRTVRFLDALWAHTAPAGDPAATAAAVAVRRGPAASPAAAAAQVSGGASPLRLVPPRPLLLRHPARFVFTSRHPLAAALALDAFATSKGLSLHDRVAHWLQVEESLDADLRAPAAAAAAPLAAARFILHRKLTLERLACRPAHELAGVLAWLGLAGWDAARVAHAAKAAAALVHAAPNAKHAAEYARRRAAGGLEGEHADLLAAFAGRVAAVDTGDPNDRYDLGRIGGVLPCRGDPAAAAVQDEL